MRKITPIIFFVCLCTIFSCSDKEKKKEGKVDLSAYIMDTEKAVKMIRHYKDLSVDWHRRWAKFSQFDPVKLHGIFGEGVQSARFYFAAYLGDEAKESWRNRPTIIIQVITPAKATPDYFLADDICPPPSSC